MILGKPKSKWPVKATAIHKAQAPTFYLTSGGGASLDSHLHHRVKVVGHETLTELALWRSCGRDAKSAVANAAHPA